MRPVSIKLKDMAIANIQMGFVGENNATQVIFECKEIFDENPYAVQLLVVTPPEGTSYEVTTARIGDNVIWNVSELDTAFEGDGSIQLVFKDGSQVIKTYNADTTVLESQVPSGTAPATALNWIQDAEAWAKGTRGGRAVEDDDPTYQNNSKYYSDKIVNMASDSEAWAKGTRDGEAVESDDPAYQNNSKYYAESIADTASDSEAYAAGTRGGEAVDEDDPAYHNNAAYYNDQAALEKAAAQAAAETASAAYNVNLLAANYDATKTYAVGEYVIYNGGLYRCISAITTAEAWTAAHWSSVTVGKDTSALKSALDANNYPFGLIYAVSGSATNTNRGITVTKNGNRIRVNGTATGNVTFAIHGNEIETAASVKSEWMTGLPVKTGAKYALIVTPISGSASLSGNYAYVRLYSSTAGVTAYASFATKSGGFRTTNNITSIIEATATNMMGIGLYMSSGDSFTNAEFVVDLIEYNNLDLLLKKTFIGDNDDLTTTEKATIVGAVNELKAYDGNHAPALQNGVFGLYGHYPRFNFSGTNIIVKIPANSPGRAFWNNGYASDAVLTEQTYTLAHTNYLVYNTNTKTLRVETSSANFTQYDIVVLYNAHGAAYGQWAAFYAKQIAEATESLVVPEWYTEEDYLADKIEDINTIAIGLGRQSLQTVFITDTHWGRNQKNSPALIQQIVKETGIQNVIFGGDSIEKDTTSKLGGYNMICGFLNEFSRPIANVANLYQISGNHEYNDPSGSASSLRLSEGVIDHLLNTPISYKIHALDGVNTFYVDDDTVKIRYYCVECDYASIISLDTRARIFESLLNVPEGYAVVVFSHTGVDSADNTQLTGRFSQIMECCAAMNDGTSVTINSVTYDFTGKARTFVGAITGHLHKDCYVIYDDRFPVISCAADCMPQTTSPNRTAGTITEQSFNMVQIDVAAKRIYLTRIGAGDDQVFSFGTGAGVIT